MAFVVKVDESLDPSDVGLLRHVTIVARANRLADLIEELGFRPRWRRTDRCAAIESINVQ